MGIYASSFRNDDGPVIDVSHPSKADWITSHATASGLAIVEVERLWYRFQQLGCTDQGVLSSDVLTRPPASSDIFVKNIFTTFRNPRDPDYNITFLTFLNAMTWAENADVEKKIRAIFHLVNNGYPISKDILLKVLKRLYPDENERAIAQTADVVINQMDTKKKGFIDEDQFTTYVMRLPADAVQPLLSFDIIPQDINAEAHRSFTNQTRATAYSQQTPRGGPVTPGSVPSISRQIPTDGKLRDITNKIHKRDWQMVANRLGLTQHDITQIQTTAGKESYGQCYEMLKTWRSRAGSEAFAEVLEKALRDSNMNDAAMLLQP